MMKRILTTGVALLASVAMAAAQTPPAAQTTAPAQPKPVARVASPAGSSQTQIGSGATGKWIEITYGRPIKRGRADLWGKDADYGKALLAGAPIWRAGANVSTRLKTELPLVIAGKTVPAGEYSLFIELKSPTEWTLVVSSWPAQEKYDKANTAALWGAYGYTPDKDVARIAMKVEKLPLSIDQLTWDFADVTATGGKLVIMWDTNMATAPFAIGQ